MVAYGSGALGACCLLLGIRAAEAAFLRLRDGERDLGDGFRQDGADRLALAAVQGETHFQASADGLEDLAGSEEGLEEEDAELASDGANLSQAILQELRDLAARGYRLRPAGADRLAERAALGGNLSEAGAAPPVELAAGPEEPSYAYEKYTVGQVVEGRKKGGGWLPAVVVGVNQAQTFEVHISDDYPGYDLPQVPHGLLRRPLLPSEADWLVDNSELQHKAHGLRFRHSKNLEDKSDEYAPWGTLVVGTNEGDGWVKAATGYLPITFRSARVLVRTERKGEVISTSEEVPGMMHSDGPVFEVAEPGEFRLQNGSWFPCRITGMGWARNTYDIIVTPGEYLAIPVVNVPVQRLRRVSPAPPRTPEHFAAPDCRHEGGCIVLRVKLVHKKAPGRTFLLHLSRQSEFNLIMKMVCSKLKVTWESCQSDYHFQHLGKQIDTTKSISASGLYNDALVFMMEGPAPATNLNHRAPLVD